MSRKDRTPKTHVCEGTTATGAKRLACGPFVRDNVPTVARAKVLAKVDCDAVTCTKCRTVYRLEVAS